MWHSLGQRTIMLRLRPSAHMSISFRIAVFFGIPGSLTFVATFPPFRSFDVSIVTLHTPHAPVKGLEINGCLEIADQL